MRREKVSRGSAAQREGGLVKAPRVRTLQPLWSAPRNRAAGLRYRTYPRRFVLERKLGWYREVQRFRPYSGVKSVFLQQNNVLGEKKWKSSA